MIFPYACYLHSSVATALEKGILSWFPNASKDNKNTCNHELCKDVTAHLETGQLASGQAKANIT